MGFKKIWNITGTVFLIGAILYFIFFQPSRNELCKENLEILRRDIYNGKILMKYVDYKEHSSKTLKILNSENDTVLWVITYDKSGLYDYIQVNDSIIKKLGKLQVKLYRKNHRVKIFTLDLGCDSL